VTARPPNPLASSGVDRSAAVRRSPEVLAELAAHPDARLLVVRPPWVLLVADGPALLPVEGLEGRDAPVLLGVNDGVPTWAIDSVEEDAERFRERAGPEGRWSTLMEVGAVIDSRHASLLAQALGLANWHRRHRFCGSCGAPTQVGEAGYLLTCTACATPHFPRLDPAVIMLVTDGRRCILGRQTVWPARMYSALAGFVEPGESLEDAVAREVAEEVGVVVTDVRYHSSQPWPFPSSIMLGFTATAVGDEITVDRSELDDARWWDADEIVEASADGALMLPGTISIARQLVDSWLAE
jgi:NAD+ diphosphatase